MKLLVDYFDKIAERTRTMCGIVGLFLKQQEDEQDLGRMFAPMLATMCGRGPDSAGFAVYNGTVPEGSLRISLHHPDAHFDWSDVATRTAAIDCEVKSTHAFLTVPGDEHRVRQQVAEAFPEVSVMSAGRRIRLMKATGLPSEVARQFDLTSMSGSHAIGHTRMATESRVSTAGSHPFSTGMDLCLVHNGSLSNHNVLRRHLRREGIDFATDNDSEVAAGYLTWRLRSGMDLKEALTAALADLDGFFTFAVGTADGFAVLRDPVACKPAVLAETDRFVAMASEYRALVGLPGIESARLWEPEPGVVYNWSKS